MSLPSTKVVTIPEFVNATFVARLARAIVMELQPLERILEEFKLTRDQFEVIKLTSYFKRVSEEFSAEWNRISSTQDRLRLISAVLLEEGLPRVGSHMIDPNITPAVAVESGKFLAKVAGVGEGSKAGEATAGEKFTITINLGADQTLKFTKDATAGRTKTPALGEEEEIPGIPTWEDGPETMVGESNPGTISSDQKKKELMGTITEGSSGGETVEADTEGEGVVSEEQDKS